MKILNSLVFVLLACLSLEAKEFTISKDAIKISIPDNWTINDDGASNPEPICFSASEINEKHYANILIIRIPHDAFGNDNLKSYADAYIEGYRKQKNFKVLKQPEETTLNGTKYQKLEMQHQFPGIDDKGAMLHYYTSITSKNGAFYVFVFQNAIPSSEEIKTTAKNFFSQIRFP